MKGYVSVTFTDKQKQELFDLYEKINEFNKKPREEVFWCVILEVNKSFLWWKWQGEIKWWEFKCPEELQPFFDRQRIEAALNTTFRTAPQGMTREQKRAFMSGKI